MQLDDCSEESGSDVNSNPDASREIQPEDDLDEAANLEPWVDWIRRCTHEAEACMTKLRIDDWITLQRRRKMKWAQKLTNDAHDTWTTAAIRWDPTLDAHMNAKRRPGRPKTRWMDDIDNLSTNVDTALTTTTQR